mgnify:FL=1
MAYRRAKFIIEAEISRSEVRLFEIVRIFFKYRLFFANVVRLTFPEPYDLGHTFDCGQIFRFETFDNGKSYLGPLKDRIIKIESIDSHTLEITSNKRTELEVLIRSFLRVGDDYLAMQQAIAINS